MRNRWRWFTGVTMLYLALGLSGCANHPINAAPVVNRLDPSESGVPTQVTGSQSASIPDSIRRSSANNLALANVVNRRNVPEGTPVRWGGTIVSLANASGWTAIEVAAHDLDAQGEPDLNQPARGRFVARAQIPFDDTVYAQGRPITVAGTLSGFESAGDANQTGLPVVDADTVFFWGESAEAGSHYEYAMRPKTYNLGRTYYPRRYYRPYGYRYRSWYWPRLSLGLGYCRGCGGWRAYPGLSWGGVGFHFGYDH